MTIMKQFLKKILPPPTASFNREVEHILTAMQSNHQDLSKIHEENVRLQREIAALKQEVSDLKGSKARLTEEIRLQTNQTNRMLAERKTAEDTLLKDLKGRQSEVLWGEIFRDTIVNSIWLGGRLSIFICALSCFGRGATKADFGTWIGPDDSDDRPICVGI